MKNEVFIQRNICHAQSLMMKQICTRHAYFIFFFFLFYLLICFLKQRTIYRCPVGGIIKRSAYCMCMQRSVYACILCTSMAAYAWCVRFMCAVLVNEKSVLAACKVIIVFFWKLFDCTFMSYDETIKLIRQF